MNVFAETKLDEEKVLWVRKRYFGQGNSFMKTRKRDFRNIVMDLHL